MTDAINVIMRWLHITSVLMLIGGLLFARLVLVGQHGVYCHSARHPGKPAMDVQLITKAITDAKELISGVMAELKSAKAPAENN